MTVFPPSAVFLFTLTLGVLGSFHIVEREVPPPAALAAGGGVSGIETDSSRAYTRLSYHDQQLTIQSYFANNGVPAGSLSYHLTTQLSGRSRSTSSQGGSFNTQPGRADTLAVTRLSAAPADHIEITLRIHSGDRAIARTHISGTLHDILSIP